MWRPRSAPQRQKGQAENLLLARVFGSGTQEEDGGAVPPSQGGEGQGQEEVSDVRAPAVQVNS
jgi:hypothetical protein